MDTLKKLIKSFETDKNNGEKHYRELYETLQKDLYFTEDFLTWIHNNTNQYAQLCLGIMHYLESGVIKNQEEMIKLFKSSADQGNPYAQRELGFDYIYNQKNYDEGYKWLKLSADAGNLCALAELGDCYYNGWGVPKDVKRAQELFEQSALNNNSVGQYNLAKLHYVNGDYPRALEWFMKSKDKKDESLNFIGCLYFYGYGVKQNYREAHRYFAAAAAKDSYTGYANLGLMYLHGYGVKRDSKQALFWNKLSADNNDGYGQRNLGTMYSNGWGVPKDTNRALELFKLSADQGTDGSKKYYDDLYRQINPPQA
jgi:uncharacterized protein